MNKSNNLVFLHLEANFTTKFHTMGNTGWSKLPRNRQYNYNPRYWNQKKEALDTRIKNVELTKKGDVNAMKARIREGISRGYVKETASFRKKKVLRANLTLIAVIFLLIIIAYYGLTVYLPKMLDALNLQ